MAAEGKVWSLHRPDHGAAHSPALSWGSSHDNRSGPGQQTIGGPSAIRPSDFPALNSSCPLTWDRCPCCVQASSRANRQDLRPADLVLRLVAERGLLLRELLVVTSHRGGRRRSSRTGSSGAWSDRAHKHARHWSQPCGASQRPRAMAYSAKWLAPAEQGPGPGSEQATKQRRARLLYLRLEDS